MWVNGNPAAINSAKGRRTGGVGVESRQGKGEQLRVGSSVSRAVGQTSAGITDKTEPSAEETAGRPAAGGRRAADLTVL